MYVLYDSYHEDKQLSPLAPSKQFNLLSEDILKKKKWTWMIMWFFGSGGNVDFYI